MQSIPQPCRLCRRLLVPQAADNEQAVLELQLLRAVVANRRGGVHHLLSAACGEAPVHRPRRLSPHALVGEVGLFGCAPAFWLCAGYGHHLLDVSREVDELGHADRRTGGVRRVHPLAYPGARGTIGAPSSYSSCSLVSPAPRQADRACFGPGFVCEVWGNAPVRARARHRPVWLACGVAQAVVFGVGSDADGVWGALLVQFDYFVNGQELNVRGGDYKSQQTIYML
eukprot:3735941-Prymnesium_polylepis.1